MKKTFLFVALAAVAAASCSKAEYLGQQPQKVEKQSPIEIGTSVGVPTKAEGAAAATLLNNKFVVYGQKTVDGTVSEVFDAVPVSYANGEWSYVTTSQALRYWDSNASKYDFAACSDANTTPVVTAATDVYADGFKIAKTNAEGLAKVYVTPAITVGTSGFTSPITFSFSNAAAKVRVGFYNAIPGYEVNVDKFYATDDEEGGANTTLKGTFFEKAAYTVNKSAVLKTDGDPDTMPDLVLGNKIVQCTNANQYIGKDIKHASYDKEDGTYTNVLPVMTDGKDITLRVSYRMISGHDIISRTCDVKVPATYAQWESNYAYTYLFRITDNDLHPITFSAVVSDPKNYETITTIDGDNPVNITAQQDGSDVTVDGGFKKGVDIFVSVENAGTAFDVYSGFTTDDTINGSNAASKISESEWTLRTKTTNGRYLINPEEAGYYVIRVKYVVPGSSPATTHNAYMILKVVE